VALDSLGHTRLSLVQVHEEAVDAVVPLKRRAAMGQFDLFGPAADTATSPLAHLRFDDVEWPRKQLLAYEREMLGLYVSAHPLDGAESLLRRHAPRPIAAVLDRPPKEGELVVSGLITALERRVTKKGEPWAVCTVSDMDGALEVLFFPKAYALFGADLVEDNAVVVKGRVNWREDRMSVFGSSLAVLDLASAGEDPLVLRARVGVVDLAAEAVHRREALLRVGQVADRQAAAVGHPWAAARVWRRAAVCHRLVAEASRPIQRCRWA